jgi:cell division protein FtsB
MLHTRSEATTKVGSSRDERRRDEPGLRRKAASLASVLALIALAVGSLFGEGGILHLVEQRRKAESLRTVIEELRAENSRLAAEIVALTTDPRAIERIAREQLGMAQPGETVFLIHEDDARERR